MPVYEYECEKCGTFTELRGIDRSSMPANCPECGSLASKVFSGINLGVMRPENRSAWERNERSAHAPHVCGAGCSHGQVKPRNSVKADGEKPALKYSTKPNSRPWMLGH